MQSSWTSTFSTVIIELLSETSVRKKITRLMLPDCTFDNISGTITDFYCIIRKCEGGGDGARGQDKSRRKSFVGVGKIANFERAAWGQSLTGRESAVSRADHDERATVLIRYKSPM